MLKIIVQTNGSLKTGDIDSGNGYYFLSSGVKEGFGKAYDEGDPLVKTNFYWTEVISDMITLKSSSETSSGTSISGSAGTTRLISDLASYFRYNSYEKTRRDSNSTAVRDKWGAKAYIPNMIMYAILVAQSLILFISYVKRLFYVILLAMMAPIVVVFDFFQKFGK